MLQGLRESSSTENQRRINATLAHLEQCLGHTLGPPFLGRQDCLKPSAETPLSHNIFDCSGRRFLGHVSDVSFFNSVRQLIQSSREQDAPPDMESYERDVGDLDLTLRRVAFDLPDKSLADRLVDVYFGTIHIAYPFICRQQFLQDYQSFWERSADVHASHSIKPLLCQS